MGISAAGAVPAMYRGAQIDGPGRPDRHVGVERLLLNRQTVRLELRRDVLPRLGRAFRTRRTGPNLHDLPQVLEGARPVEAGGFLGWSGR